MAKNHSRYDMSLQFNIRIGLNIDPTSAKHFLQL